MEILDALLARLVKLRSDVDSKPVMRWATVTSAFPLDIRLDGDETPLGVKPDSCVGGLLVGERVRVELQNNRITILGVAGGMKPVGSNRILNGGFDVWQRGTSGTPTSASTAYVADRFESWRTGYAAGLTVSRQAAGVPGIQYAARVQRTAGNASTAAINIGQAFETVDSIPLQGQTVTFSFYARKGANFSSAGSILNAAIVSGTGTDQNLRGGFTGSAAVVAGTAELSTGWQRFTFTGVVPVGATQVGVRLDYNPVGTAGANDWFEITGVQLETGGVSTFRRQNNSYQSELAACQRYYVRFTADAVTGYSAVSSGMFGATGLGTCAVSLPEEMRVTPTALEYATPSGIYFSDTNSSPIANATLTLDPNYKSTKALSLYSASGGAGTAYRPCFLNLVGSGKYLGISAEL